MEGVHAVRPRLRSIRVVAAVANQQAGDGMDRRHEVEPHAEEGVQPLAWIGGGKGGAKASVDVDALVCTSHECHEQASP